MITRRFANGKEVPVHLIPLFDQAVEVAEKKGISVSIIHILDKDMMFAHSNIDNVAKMAKDLGGHYYGSIIVLR